MSAPRSITDFELKRLAAIAKREQVRVRYQRTADAPIIEIVPDIPATHRPNDVDEQDNFTL